MEGDSMPDSSKIVDFNLFIDEELATLFRKVTSENGVAAKDVLTDFMKDYVVSGGHPEQVVNKWPWNKKA
jgi:hypothetical protein